MPAAAMGRERSGIMRDGKNIKYLGKLCAISLTYIILLQISHVLGFQVLMAQLTQEEIENGGSWIGKRGMELFLGPWETGFFMALLLAVILFLIFHGRHIELRRFRKIPHIAGSFWQRTLAQGAALTGIVLGILWFGTDKLSTGIANHIASMSDVYFFLSGTAAYATFPGSPDATEVGTVLWGISDIFWREMIMWDLSYIGMIVAYVFYELLRICFDRTVPLDAQ